MDQSDSKRHYRRYWERFCTRFGITEACVPLFAHDPSMVVALKEIGRSRRRLVLTRNPEMESLVRSEARIAVRDWAEGGNEYDGLIYMMMILDDSGPVPLYIGKAERLGKGNRNLSENLRGIERDQSKFARWGYGYAYHMGDLSAVTVPGHSPERATRKYAGWASALFADYPTPRPILKEEVYFWTKAWRKTDVGVWEGFGATRLSFLEYLLIGVASAAFPSSLLNQEGQNRL